MLDPLQNMIVTYLELRGSINALTTPLDCASLRNTSICARFVSTHAALATASSLESTRQLISGSIPLKFCISLVE